MPSEIESIKHVGSARPLIMVQPHRHPVRLHFQPGADGAGAEPSGLPQDEVDDRMAPRPAELAVPVGERDHALGDPQALVKLVEYGDYQCPACAEAGPVVEVLRRRFGSRLCIVFRHFPLPEVHPAAQFAAEAAEAAASQDRFHEMHKRLLEHQHLLERGFLSWHAAAVGLHVAAFEREMSLHLHESKVHDDTVGGVRSGVGHTPTFFINGVRYDGPVDADALSQAIERAEADHAGRPEYLLPQTSLHNGRRDGH